MPTPDAPFKIASVQASPGVWGTPFTIAGKVSRRKLDQLNAVVSLGSLRIPPGNKLESLKGDRLGQYSIRINEQFRICFIWTEQGPERVEITDYH